MVTHLHVRLQIPDANPPVYRDVILPDSVLLDDINQVISVCFGWPFTTTFEFVSQQTKTSYIGDNENFSNAPYSIPADNFNLAALFLKNSEILYYRGTHQSDCISITLQSMKSLLPEPAFQLKSWQGENRACSRGCIPFLKQKVADDLQALRAELYFLADEFDYQTMTSTDLRSALESAESLDELANPEEHPEQELIDYLMQFDMPEEAILQSATLEQCLANTADMILENLVKLHKLSDDAALSREQMENLLFTALTDEAFLAEQLKVLTVPEVEMLNFLTKTNLPLFSQDVTLHGGYLLLCGLCFVDETGQYITVPVELRRLYQKLLKNEELMMDVQYFDMLHTFCYTAVYLYGLYPIRRIIRLIGENMHLVLSADELTSTLKRAATERYDYVFRDGYVIASQLAEDDPSCQKVIQQLKQRQETTTDFFWPDIDQLEALIFQRRLANEQLYQQFLMDFHPYLEAAVHPVLMLQNIEYWFRSGLSTSDVITLLTTHYLHIQNHDIIQALTSSLNEISMQTPRWNLCGYSPEAMARKKETKPSVRPSGKSGGTIISFQEHLDRKNRK